LHFKVKSAQTCYRIGESLDLSAAVTRNTSTALLNNSRVTVQAATRDIYSELAFVWMF